MADTYTPEEIADYAQQLHDKGASPTEIETFVAANAPKSAPAPAPTGIGAIDTALSRARMTDDAMKIANMAKGTGLTGGLGTAGAIVGGAYFGPWGARAGLAAGSMLGNVLGQETSPGYDANQPMLGIKPGEVAMTGATALLPTPSMVNAGAGKYLAQGAKYGAANVVLDNARSLIDTGDISSAGGNIAAFLGGALSPVMAGRMDKNMEGSTPEAQRAAAQVTDKNLKQQQFLDSGYISNPYEMNKGAVTKTATKIARPESQLSAEIIQANQKNTDLKSAQSVAPIDTATGERVVPPVLDKASLQSLENHYAIPYDTLASTDPHAAMLLDKWKKLNSRSNDYYRDGHLNNNAVAKEKAVSLREEADAVFDALKAEARRQNFDMQTFEDARVALAKVNVLKRAANPVTGEVDAHLIKQQQEDGFKLTGELEDIANAVDHNPRALKLASALPPMNDLTSKPGLVKRGIYSLAGSGLGAMVAGHPGMAAGALAGNALAEHSIVGPMVRKALLSSPYQRSSFAQTPMPTYRPDLSAQIARFIAMNAGQ